MRCHICQRSCLLELPGERPYRHSSEPFRNQIYQLHQDGVCANALGRSQQLGQATVGRIYQQFTVRKADEQITRNCPFYLSIDEHTLYKGQHFCTTFYDLKNISCLTFIPDKVKPT